MKTIGLIGGMSWESSAVYYNIINRKVRDLKGGFHCAKSILLTVDFAEIQRLQHEEDWKSLDEIMVNSAKQLEVAGADFVVLCTNTMHLCSPVILENISIPFLHIAEATGMEILKTGDLKRWLCWVQNLQWRRTFIKPIFSISLVLKL